MASSSTVPSVSEMVELRANGLRIPILFPIDANGFASVSSLHLSIRFSMQDRTIWVEREIYDSDTSLLSLTIREIPIVADNGSSMWELGAGKYRVYGLPDSSTNASTAFRTPPHSSASTFNTPSLVKVKIEPGIQTFIHLSDSSDGEDPPLSTPIHKPSPSSLPSSFVTPAKVSPLPPSPANPPLSILQCLRTLASMPGSKNILKKLDYDTLHIMEVNFLPPRFNGNCMFVLPPVGISSSYTMAKSMDGMDKRYDGHVWTKPPTFPMSWALLFDRPPALATSSAIILLVTTFNVLIAPPLSMILISTVSQSSRFLLVAPCLWAPL
jgi:hypothetical protein